MLKARNFTIRASQSKRKKAPSQLSIQHKAVTVFPKSQTDTRALSQTPQNDTRPTFLHLQTIIYYHNFIHKESKAVHMDKATINFGQL